MHYRDKLHRKCYLINFELSYYHEYLWSYRRISPLYWMSKEGILLMSLFSATYMKVFPTFSLITKIILTETDHKTRQESCACVYLSWNAVQSLQCKLLMTISRVWMHSSLSPSASLLAAAHLWSVWMASLDQRPASVLLQRRHDLYAPWHFTKDHQQPYCY